ncbi:MAG: hypothetical protein R3C11_08080 [Planctomycetaceae bacterium]
MNDIPPRESVDVEAGPFPVAGGWSRDSIEAGSLKFSITRPAEPDALLDDPQVIAENEQEVYIPYWGLLWPAAIKMAQIFTRQAWEPGVPCLELGCGIGLVGLAALRQGLHVTFSDYRQEAVDLACWNARTNGYLPEQEYHGLQIDWNTPPAEKKYRHIFGCELVYETDFHEPILKALEVLLEPAGECWFADSGRMHSEKFLELAESTGWKIERLNQELQPLLNPQIGRFQVFRIARS